jgi:hypothetical protein
MDSVKCLKVTKIGRYRAMSSLDLRRERLSLNLELKQTTHINERFRIKESMALINRVLDEKEGCRP